MEGLITVSSQFGHQETAQRLEAAVMAKGLTIFARVDHAAGASAAGLVLRPTLLFLFGNARGGTPLMQASQLVGIDLPLKTLIWEDEAGKTWASYVDPHFIAARHGLGAASDPVTTAMAGALASVTKAATG
jgi:uncharacterized protein (DUF302 family)